MEETLKKIKEKQDYLSSLGIQVAQLEIKHNGLLKQAAETSNKIAELNQMEEKKRREEAGKKESELIKREADPQRLDVKKGAEEKPVIIDEKVSMQACIYFSCCLLLYACCCL